MIAAAATAVALLGDGGTAMLRADLQNLLPAAAAAQPRAATRPCSIPQSKYCAAIYCAEKIHLSNEK